MDCGRIVTAHLPNPGRLWELLLPDAPVLLERLDRGGRSLGSRYRLLAVESRGSLVFLDTVRTNRVARLLLERDLIPGLERARPVRSEVNLGGHRFDFLVRRDGTETLLEVKSCTLFGNGVAMFPDAVTERGRRHLLALARYGRRGRRPIVLFVVHTPGVRWFLPDYHTDLAFARTLLALRHRLDVVAVAVRWRRDLSLVPCVGRLEIPWRFLEREAEDRGSYLLLIRLPRARRLAYGARREATFHPGWYIYVGSAMRHMTARLARHARQRKRFHWHADRLRACASEAIPLAIRTAARIECALARDLARLYPSGAPGFGASDCSCPTHLFFRGSGSPLHDLRFHELLRRYRMRPPRGERCGAPPDGSAGVARLP